MKSRISETGRVIALEGGTALVKLEGGEACRKCGMAAIGLCKPGGTGMLLRVENPLGASKGDVVRLGLQKDAHLKGYFFAYMLPLLGFIAGAFSGRLLEPLVGVSWLDAPLAFAFLALSLLYCLRKIRAMDKAERLYISRVVREVPEFNWQEAPGPEGLRYLEAYREGGP